MSTQGQQGFFLDSNGDVYFLDNFSATPVLVEGLSNIKLLSETYESSIIYAVDSSNKFYELRTWETQINELTINIDSTLNIVDVSNWHNNNVIVLLDDGSTLTWGYHESGKYVGDGLNISGWAITYEVVQFTLNQNTST